MPESLTAACHCDGNPQGACRYPDCQSPTPTTEELVGEAAKPSLWTSLRSKRPRLVRVDDQPNSTHRRGWRLGWLRWEQDEPPYHYEWRWVQLHMLTWDRTPGLPAFKVQFEIKTYRTAGMRSIDGSKRYIRFGVCL